MEDKYIERDFYKTVGEKLRELRIKNNLTLVDASERIGCSFKTLQRYETGENRIRMGTLRELCHCYEIDYVDFVNSIKKEFGEEPNNANPVIIISPEVKEFALFSKKEQTMAINYIKFLRSQNNG